MKRGFLGPQVVGLLLLVPPPLFWAGNFIVGRAMRGDMPPLTLSFSAGDLIVFCAMVSWVFYTLWLRGIPPEIDRIGLMGAQIAVTFIVLVPLYVGEALFTYAPVWRTETSAALAYLGIFPSVLAYLLYNIGVARVGAARAGMFIHLIPMFGVILAVLFLHESLHAYHLIGMSAILAGVGCATRLAQK